MDSVLETAGPIVSIRYRNWRGEVRERLIQPVRFWHGDNEWHPEPQYLLDAIDAETGEVRTFALQGVLRWGAAPAVEHPIIDISTDPPTI